ncbi:MAG: metal-dependent hydrolase [Nanoarchaeota archaeon]
MPYAVTHFLVPVIIVSIIRDYFYRKSGNKFPLHYVLIAGLAGIAPDLDIALFWILHPFGFTLEQLHRTFAHALILPIIFFILFLITKNIKIAQLGRHKLRLANIFMAIAFGVVTHIILDGLLGGYVAPFYPFSSNEIGLNLVSYLPNDLEPLAFPSLDAALLVIYVIYLELKHKISDFI